MNYVYVMLGREENYFEKHAMTVNVRVNNDNIHILIVATCGICCSRLWIRLPLIFLCGIAFEWAFSSVPKLRKLALLIRLPKLTSVRTKNVVLHLCYPVQKH